MMRGGCFAIHSVNPRTVPVVFVTEGSFDENCDPGCHRSVLADLAGHGTLVAHGGFVCICMSRAKLFTNPLIEGSGTIFGW